MTNVSCSRTQCSDAGEAGTSITLWLYRWMIQSKFYVASALISDGEYQLNIVCKLIIEIQTSNYGEWNSWIPILKLTIISLIKYIENDLIINPQVFGIQWITFSWGVRFADQQNPSSQYINDDHKQKIVWYWHYFALREHKEYCFKHSTLIKLCKQLECY